MSLGVRFLRHSQHHHSLIGTHLRLWLAASSRGNFRAHHPVTIHAFVHLIQPGGIPDRNFDPYSYFIQAPDVFLPLEPQREMREQVSVRSVLLNAVAKLVE